VWIEEVLVISSRHPHRIRGGALGATIGAVIGLVVVLLIDLLVRGDQNDLFWLPAGIVTGLFAGAMVGLLLAETWIGGHLDELATAEAEAALAQERAREAPSELE
jgi:hypothetical protein